MALTLITGPANAAKVGAVIDRLRAALAQEPLFVVPTAADVEQYRVELASAQLVFGVEVTSFGGLIDAIANRVGFAQRPIGRITRERVVEAAVRRTELKLLASSAATTGFVKALGGLFAELQGAFATPGRFIQAVRVWREEAPEEVPPHANELCDLYAAYCNRLDRLGWVDTHGYAWKVLDRLRVDPSSWGSRPVFLYGFDDLTPIQLDSVITFVDRVGADVCVALPYEPGRAAVAGCAAVVESLKPFAERHIALPQRSEYYSEVSRDALHHLERSLFEPGNERRSPDGAVRLLEAGGERAEAELVGAEVLELIGEGVAPSEIAVLIRDSNSAELFSQVLTGYGVPVSHQRRSTLAKTGLGHGVLAYARAALPAGTATDLVTWLRTPGKVVDIDDVDELEARMRRAGTLTAIEARKVWEEELELVSLDALDELADAATMSSAAYVTRLAREAERIWTA